MIEFIFPFSGEPPKAANVFIEEWQKDIEKILEKVNINEVIIKYKK